MRKFGVKLFNLALGSKIGRSKDMILCFGNNYVRRQFCALKAIGAISNIANTLLDF